MPQTSHRVHLDLEVLGGRTLLSVSPILSVAAHTPIAPSTHPIAASVGRTEPARLHLPLEFHQWQATHTLDIKTETYNWLGSAPFTGTWSGDGPNSKAVSGTLVFAANSTTVVNVNFTWTNGSSPQKQLLW